ncbi:hypothetical protein MKW92_040768 [Papaver armeniacum]|nr:hypothetical protein MKW92_040768 [Papaver armeniacum]
MSLAGIVYFTVRWWDPATFEAMHPEGSTSQRASWPFVEDKSYLWTLFVVPLVAYTLWQILYFLIVNVLELSKKAQKANNMWWRLSGVLGDQNRMLMYILFQAAFTVATMALIFLLEVMPTQLIMKEKKKLEMMPLPVQSDQPAIVSTEIPTETNGFTESKNQSEHPCIKENDL